MKILDENRLTTGLGSDLTSDTVGIVFKTAEEMGDFSLGLFIPKLMIGYELKSGDGPSEKSVSISNSKILNSSSVKFGSNSVKIKNYIQAYPLLNQNITMAEYVVGDKVFVSFIDQDIKTIVFFPYSINRLGQRAVDKFMAAVPATQKFNNELTTDNTYYLMLDSKNSQSVVLATSKDNKEICKFEFIMDGKNGLMKLTDEERTILIDNQSDMISLTNKGGSSITLMEDQITLRANTLNIETETDINITTDQYNITSSTYKSTIDTVDSTHETENVTVTKGVYKIRQEKHENTTTSFKSSTFHADSPLVGLNGSVIFPNFSIGAIPNINSPVPPTNGSSGPSGKMVFSTGSGGSPLCKYDVMISILASIGSIIDGKTPSSPGATMGSISSLIGRLATTKISST